MMSKIVMLLLYKQVIKTAMNKIMCMHGHNYLLAIIITNMYLRLSKHVQCSTRRE